MKDNRVPVSIVETVCVPFHRKQKGTQGYKIGENPVKANGFYVESNEDALAMLRKMKLAGWRDCGAGNNGGARKALGWDTKADAEMLLAEKSESRRIDLFRSINDVVK